MKKIPPHSWWKDAVYPNLSLAMNQFDWILDSQEWEQIEDLAADIFLGHLELMSLPVNMMEHWLGSHLLGCVVAPPGFS